jgi:hypothetical protein
MTEPDRIAATIAPLAPETIGARDGQLGKLNWRWGMQISSKDPRLGPITGLSFDRKYGLIAVTSKKTWVMFDLVGPNLGALRSVSAAQMRGAPGVPSAIATAGPWLFVDFPAQRQVDRFELSTCGIAASGVPMVQVKDDGSPGTVVFAAYSYLGVVAQHGDAVNGAILTPYSRDRVAPAFGKVFAAPKGQTLVALSNPFGITPHLLAMWRPVSGSGRSRLQRVYVQDWSDVGGPGESLVEDIAEPKGRITAMTSGYTGSEILVFLAADGGVDGAVNLYAFSLDSTDW